MSSMSVAASLKNTMRDWRTASWPIFITALKKREKKNLIPKNLKPRQLKP